MMSPKNVPVYDGLSDESLEQLVRDLGRAYGAAARLGVVSEGGPEIDIDEGEGVVAKVSAFGQLIGIDDAVYRQVNAALQAGKQHFMLYGPPGTGKTTFAQYLAGALSRRWTLLTGSADWSSQDIIGGYQPVGHGDVKFVPGILLQNFDRPLIVDELNRCDIDKVIGPLFTVLSGQPTTLPYRVDLGDPTSAQYAIFPQPRPSAQPHEYAPRPGWRLIATINSIDKASLYQLSYALTRRFAWIYLDIPEDLEGFVIEYLRRQGLLSGAVAPDVRVPLAQMWEGINHVRAIGPAPFIDLMLTAHAVAPAIDFTRAPSVVEIDAYLDGFYMYVLPMLDGILQQDAKRLLDAIAVALGMTEGDDRRQELSRRLLAMSI